MMYIHENFYFGWILYNVICISTFCIYLKRKSSYVNSFINIYILFCVLLALFGSSIGPDYLPYHDIIKEISIYKNDAFTHVEDIYVYMISNFIDDYFLFQCVIYITSYLGFYYIFKDFCERNRSILLLIFIYSILGLYSSIISRQIISIVFFYLSILFFSRKKYLYTFLFLIASYFLHKIGIILISVFIISLIWKCTLKERMKWFYLLPIFVFLGNYLISFYQDWFLNNIFGAHYLYNEEQKGGNIIWKIVSNYQLVVKVLMSLHIIYHYRKTDLFSYDMLLYKILYISAYLGIMFYCMNITDESLVNRCFYIAVLPICYFYSKMFSNFTKHKKILIFYMFFFYYISVNIYIIRVSFSNL